MRLVIFHGSPRRGNTYRAATLFLQGLRRQGEVQVQEFFLPEDLPVFCEGCQKCFGGSPEGCPHTRYVAPMVQAVLDAEALFFTTPHYGASDMSGAMKNLLDHLEMFSMQIAPRREIFAKKAFVLTTGAGSGSALVPMRRGLKRWGINRVYCLALRMRTNQWDSMPKSRQEQFCEKLRYAAKKFYQAKPRSPYLSTVWEYYLFRFVLQKFVGSEAYPYQHWQEMGFLEANPFLQRRGRE